ncbi:MAG: LicD family protein [Bacteroidales bacterium]|jgi:lipopolysaccharide cholinephosphotransferase|nr:LicD family protein [Bacteroidales bacterium]
MNEDFSKYNGENTVLRKAQLRLLDMLLELDKICKKHNIPYWIDGGSTLGALRHDGFIPWDDDIDIALLRKDYRKLTKILKVELPENLVLQNHKNEKHYHMLYARVVDKHSLADYGVEKAPFRKHFKYQGLFLDIFYIDRGSLGLKRFVDFFYFISFRIIRKHNKRGNNKLMWLFSHLVWLTSRFFVFSLRRLSFLFPKDKLIYGFGVPYNWEFRRHEILPVKPIKFEGKTVSGPSDTHAYLTRCFGNYMEIPPKDQRPAHAKTIKVY